MMHSKVVTSIDAAALLNWMRKTLGHVGEALEVHVLAGGQSNPTYALHDGHHRWVLRKQPGGTLLPSAHAVDREYRIQQTLADTGVPVPRMVGYCDDASIVGTPFYLMDWLDGRVMADYALPDVPASQRRSYYRAMARTLARLHNVDWKAAGLSDYGRAGNFFERQIARWTRQWQAAATQPDNSIDRLIEWLRTHTPVHDDASDATTLVHGDFRFGNLMFHPHRPEVIAVLDWELSTLGHPLTDVAYSAMAWHMLPEEFNGLGGRDLGQLQVPSQSEYFAEYQNARDQQEDVTTFHLVFSMFRFAAILAGVAARARQGNASGSNAEGVGALASAFARKALSLV